MKLRVKRTGRTIDVQSIDYLEGDTTISIRYHTEDGYPDCYDFESLKEMNDTLEDYEPVEPLIKDEKIRKAVRAWAEANEVFSASTYKSCSDGHYWYIRAFNDTERGIDIDLWGNMPKELIDCKCYTIEELCGEEEECEN